MKMIIVTIFCQKQASKVPLNYFVNRIAKQKKSSKNTAIYCNFECFVEYYFLQSTCMCRCGRKETNNKTKSLTQPFYTFYVDLQ